MLYFTTLLKTKTRFDDINFLTNLHIILVISLKLVLPQILTSAIVACFLVLIYKIIFGSLPKWAFPSFFAYSILGICLGYLAGISVGGVLEKFLPALITFISGILAFITTQNLTEEYRSSIPFFISSFVSSTAIGVSYGTYIETIIS